MVRYHISPDKRLSMKFIIPIPISKIIDNWSEQEEQCEGDRPRLHRTTMRQIVQELPKIYTRCSFVWTVNRVRKVASRKRSAPLYNGTLLCRGEVCTLKAHITVREGKDDIFNVEWSGTEGHVM